MLDSRLYGNNGILHANGGTSSSFQKSDHQKITKANQKIAKASGFALAGLALPAALTYGLPSGGQVVGGDASIDRQGSVLDVSQFSNRAIINWSDFDIQKSETVRFVQPDESSWILNRDTSGAASQILGNLNANGRVFLLNPQGILVGGGSRVNVGSLVLSTSDMDNADFMQGNYRFVRAGNSNASVLNQGEIRSAEGGFVGLIGARVENQGYIAARGGVVHLASASTFALDFTGDGLLLFEAGGEASSGSGVTQTQSGEIQAESVFISARQAESILDRAINVEGVVHARNISQQGGRIVLDAGDGHAEVSGELNASGETGGRVDVFGAGIVLETNASLKASGYRGAGGSIRIGGDYLGKNPQVSNAQQVIVQQGANIAANAGETGDAGRVIVWSDGNTSYRGNMEAVGGDNNGFIEVSGKHGLEIAGKVNAETVLFDPKVLVWDDTSAVSVDPDLVDISLGSITTSHIHLTTSVTNPSTTVTLTQTLNANTDQVNVGSDIWGALGNAVTVLNFNAQTISVGGDTVAPPSGHLVSAAYTVSLNATHKAIWTAKAFSLQATLSSDATSVVLGSLHIHTGDLTIGLTDAVQTINAGLTVTAESILFQGNMDFPGAEANVFSLSGTDGNRKLLFGSGVETLNFGGAFSVDNANTIRIDSFELDISATERIDIGTDSLTAYGDVNLTSGVFLVINVAERMAIGTAQNRILEVVAPSLVLSVVSDDSSTLSLDVVGTFIDYAGDLYLTATSSDLFLSRLQVDGNLTIGADNIRTRNGVTDQFSVGGTASLIAGSVNLSLGPHDFNVISLIPQTANADSTLLLNEANDVTVHHAGSGDLNLVDTTVAGNLDVSATGGVVLDNANNRYGTLQFNSGGEVSINYTGDLNLMDVVGGGSNGVSLSATGDINVSGTLDYATKGVVSAGGDVSLNVVRTDNGDGGFTVTGNDINIAALSLLGRGVTLFASNDVSVHGGIGSLILNVGGNALINNTLASSALEINVLTVGGNLTITAAGINDNNYLDTFGVNGIASLVVSDGVTLDASNAGAHNFNVISLIPQSANADNILLLKETNNVTVHRAGTGDLTLGAFNINSNLDISVAGNLVQGGNNVSVLGLFNLQANNVELAGNANEFATVAGAANNVSLRHAGTDHLTLGAFNINSNLDISVAGNLVQSGNNVSVGGLFSVQANDVEMTGNANAFGILAGTVNALTLNHSAASELTLNGFTATNNLLLSVAGNLVQVGNNVSALGLFNVQANDVEMTGNANAFGTLAGTVNAITLNHSATSELTLGAFNINSNLDISVAGNLVQTGNNVSVLGLFNVQANNVELAGNANQFATLTGKVNALTLNHSASSALSLVDVTVSTMASISAGGDVAIANPANQFGTINVIAGGLISINYAGDLNLEDAVAGNNAAVNISATGDLNSSGTIRYFNTGTLGAGNDVILNIVHPHTIFGDEANLGITAGNDVNIATLSLDGARLDLSAGGNFSIYGGIRALSLLAEGSGVINNTVGTLHAITAGGNSTTVTALELRRLSIGGDLTLTAGSINENRNTTNRFTVSGIANLIVSGAVNLTSGPHDFNVISLGNQTGDADGTLLLKEANDVTLHHAGAGVLTLGDFTVADNLYLSLAGNLVQTGNNVSVLGLFNVQADNVNLTGTGNEFGTVMVATNMLALHHAGTGALTLGDITADIISLTQSDDTSGTTDLDGTSIVAQSLVVEGGSEVVLTNTDADGNPVHSVGVVTIAVADRVAFYNAIDVVLSLDYNERADLSVAGNAEVSLLNMVNAFERLSVAGDLSLTGQTLLQTGENAEFVVDGGANMILGGGAVTGELSLVDGVDFGKALSLSVYGGNVVINDISDLIIPSFEILPVGGQPLQASLTAAGDLVIAGRWDNMLAVNAGGNVALSNPGSKIVGDVVVGRYLTLDAVGATLTGSVFGYDRNESHRYIDINSANYIGPYTINTYHILGNRLGAGVVNGSVVGFETNDIVAAWRANERAAMDALQSGQDIGETAEMRYAARTGMPYAGWGSAVNLNNMIVVTLSRKLADMLNMDDELLYINNAKRGSDSE